MKITELDSGKKQYKNHNKERNAERSQTERGGGGGGGWPLER